MEIWDGYLSDGSLAGVDLVRGEPIPNGLYHLVCDILVQHIDGDFLLMQRAHEKPNYGGRYEASAGGSALKGESALECAKRELLEETGVSGATLEMIGKFVSSNTIYFEYLAITDCDKSAVTLQEGETIAYKWLSESEFITFVTNEMIDAQKTRYNEFLRERKYID